MNTGIKLLAESEEGLQVLSAALQDAIMTVGGIHFDTHAKTMTFSTSRFMHEQSDGKRVRSGLQFNNILSVKAKMIDRSDPKAFLVLLSIGFEPSKTPPGGDIVMVFAGGGELRLEAEYIEARLVDYLQERTTSKMPLHPMSD